MQPLVEHLRNLGKVIAAAFGAGDPTAADFLKDACYSTMWRKALEHCPGTATGMDNKCLWCSNTHWHRFSNCHSQLSCRWETRQCQQTPRGVKHCLPASCFNNTGGKSNNFSIYVLLSSSHAWGHNLLPKVLGHGMVFVQPLECLPHQ